MPIRKGSHSEEKMYVHYGDSAFHREKFKKARNAKYGIKPEYGLWGSPVDAEYGWKQWCEDNEFREINEKESFYFRIRGWQVYEIEKPQDLENLPHIPVLEENKRKNPYEELFLDYEKMAKGELSYSALEVKIKDVEEQLPGYDCDCILVLDDRDLVVNYDARSSSHPLTLRQLLPIKWYKRIKGDIEVCRLLKTPEGKKYIYCEQPDEHYGFKTLVACMTDGRIVETCGYTEDEAKKIVNAIMKDDLE